MYYEVQPGDQDHAHASQALAGQVSAFMLRLRPLKGVKWAQNSVLITLLDGAATIAASMSIPAETCVNYFLERYRDRRQEIRLSSDSIELPSDRKVIR
jgi:hypothetical protein